MLKQLETLDELKGCGLDHIGPKLLKLSAPVLARPITKIFNTSIAKGEFNSIFYFFESHNLLSINQSGFKKMHNCETALLKVTQNWYNSINNYESVGIVALDFRKAYELDSYEIMKEN